MAENKTNESLAFATFDRADQAEQAVEALHHAGFTSDQIRYSKQFTRENFLKSIKDLLIFPDERQDETESDILTMLQNMGITHEEIQYYTDAFIDGRFAVVVRTDGRNQQVEGILRDNHGSGYRGQ
jgi:acyl-CoA reductase-like NAD-dependent aldehyde dehydrogenase